MIEANPHYFDLSANYLFQDIAKKIKAFKEKTPDADIISLGIGDVTQPIPAACVEAMHKAVDEMGAAATMRAPLLLTAMSAPPPPPRPPSLRPRAIRAEAVQTAC